MWRRPARPFCLLTSTVYRLLIGVNVVRVIFSLFVRVFSLFAVLRFHWPTGQQQLSVQRCRDPQQFALPKSKVSLRHIWSKLVDCLKKTSWLRLFHTRNRTIDFYSCNTEHAIGHRVLCSRIVSPSVHIFLNSRSFIIRQFFLQWHTLSQVQASYAFFSLIQVETLFLTLFCFEIGLLSVIFWLHRYDLNA